MAYLTPYNENFRGIRFTEPVHWTAREFEARNLIPKIAGQVGGWWENVTGFLSNKSTWDWVGTNLPAMTNLWNTIQGQGYTTPQQQAQMQNYWQSMLGGQYGGYMQKQAQAQQGFLDKYGGWIVLGVLGLGTLGVVGMILTRRK